MTNTQSKHKLELPFVSICTPTFNRRPFFSSLIKCIEHQLYPKDKMEWIIVDDGTDPIKDLITPVDWIQVKYVYHKTRLLLGQKRNIMHSQCKGDIIVYIDDDDYYPRERVSHAVEMLMNHPTYLIAGSSEMHIYYHDLDKLYQCGPYGKYHATAATFAFRTELLQNTRYNDETALAEETKFLKNYSIPLLQLDTLKTIMVVAHSHNSFDKKKLLETPLEFKVTPSKFKVQDFIQNDQLREMYTKDIHVLIDAYSLGRPENKPEVLRQIKEIQTNRDKRLLEHSKKIQQETQRLNTLKIPQFNSMEQMKQHYEKIISDKEKIISDKSCLINELLKKIKYLNENTSK